MGNALGVGRCDGRCIVTPVVELTSLPSWYARAQPPDDVFLRILDFLPSDDALSTVRVLDGSGYVRSALARRVLQERSPRLHALARQGALARPGVAAGPSPASSASWMKLALRRVRELLVPSVEGCGWPPRLEAVVETDIPWYRQSLRSERRRLFESVMHAPSPAYRRLPAEARTRFKSAFVDNARQLDWHGLGVSILPPEMDFLPELRVLRLGGNHLSEIDIVSLAGAKLLAQLTTLDLSHNQLSNDCIASLANSRRLRQAATAARERHQTLLIDLRWNDRLSARSVAELLHSRLGSNVDVRLDEPRLRAYGLHMRRRDVLVPH